MVPAQLSPPIWQAPQLSVQVASYSSNTNMLEGAERQRLLAIAMGSSSPPTSAGPQSRTDVHFKRSPPATSNTASNARDNGGRTSQASIKSLPDSSSVSTISTEVPAKAKNEHLVNDRAAHNEIERKYRTNLKGRIAELREAIPSLRSMPEDHDEDGSPAPVLSAPNVSKVSHRPLLIPALDSSLTTSSRVPFLRKLPNTSTSLSGAIAASRVEKKDWCSG
jgi:hypothetical protein